MSVSIRPTAEESFGGNYFGTGDSVLKQWWGSTDRPKTTKRQADDAGTSLKRTSSNFRISVRGQIRAGGNPFLGWRQDHHPRNPRHRRHVYAGQYLRIKGTYTLASHDRATLAAYTTAMDAADGRGTRIKVQSTVVNRGDGTFTLFLPMSCKGWPHVSFYPADGGESFRRQLFWDGRFRAEAVVEKRLTALTLPPRAKTPRNIDSSDTSDAPMSILATLSWLVLHSWLFGFESGIAALGAPRTARPAATLGSMSGKRKLPRTPRDEVFGAVIVVCDEPHSGMVMTTSGPPVQSHPFAPGCAGRGSALFRSSSSRSSFSRSWSRPARRFRISSRRWRWAASAEWDWPTFANCSGRQPGDHRLQGRRQLGVVRFDRRPQGLLSRPAPPRQDRGRDAA